MEPDIPVLLHAKVAVDRLPGPEAPVPVFGADFWIHTKKGVPRLRYQGGL